MSLGEKYSVLPPTSINNFKSNFMLPIAHSSTSQHTYIDVSSQEGTSKKNFNSKNLELPTIVTQKSTNYQFTAGAGDSTYTGGNLHVSPYQMSSPKNNIYNNAEQMYTLESYKQNAAKELSQMKSQL